MYFCRVMRIAIIEDELLAVNYLKNLLDHQDIVPVTEIVILRSKKQAIEFFENDAADLSLWISIWAMG